MSRTSFFGKYRGMVTDNDDPLHDRPDPGPGARRLGRAESGWAMPCAPFGGTSIGFFALPPNGAGVWIEFEHGDPDYPIWTGCWWGAVAEMPPALLAPPYKKADDRHRRRQHDHLDDTPGRRRHHAGDRGGQKIALSSTGDRDRQRHGRARSADRAQGVGEQRRAGGDVMPGYVLPHRARPCSALTAARPAATSPAPRVKVGGQPAVTLTAPYTVAGCPFTRPRTPGRASRRSGWSARRGSAPAGRPLLLQDSSAIVRRRPGPRCRSSSPSCG